MNSENVYGSEDIVRLILENNTRYLNKIRKSGYGRMLFLLRPRMRKLYAEYEAASLPVEKNRACAEVLNAFEESLLWKAKVLFACTREDIRVFLRQRRQRQEIDHSGKKVRDYYSVAVIIKNEARYIEEFILFNQAAGAGRIYLYDNDSADNLMEVLEPYISSGFVVYRKWPGKKVQTAAYRHAIRKARRRTRWLALIDADEFLFSPKGKMPDQLKAYEAYPGIGVNWLTFGPNGHIERPEGLIMNNYTERIAHPWSLINLHIKTVLQPRRVLCMPRVHYAIYKGKGYAVDECREKIGNTYSYIEKSGRAFTGVNRRDVFRIHHYFTKSHEDLKAKCLRGFPDGTPNAVFEDLLRAFDTDLVQDYTIRPYADTVSELMLSRPRRAGDRI